MNRIRCCYKIANNKLFLLAIFFVSLPLLFLKLPDPTPSIYWKHFSDFLHFPLGILIFLFVHKLFSKKKFGTFKLLAISLVVIILIEIIQHLTGRDAELIDIILGLAGALFCKSLFFVLEGKKRKPEEKDLDNKLRLVAFSVVLLQLLNFIGLYQDIFYRQSKFPIIENFENKSTLNFFKIGSNKYKSINIKEIVTLDNGLKSLRVKSNANKSKWNTLRLELSGFDSDICPILTFKILNPLDEFKLYFRADDHKSRKKYSQRINKELEVKQGENTLEIDLRELSSKLKNKDFSLKNLRHLYWFTEFPHHPYYYIYEIGYTCR